MDSLGTWPGGRALGETGLSDHSAIEVAALRALLDREATSEWPEEFRERLAAVVPVVNNLAPGAFEVKALVSNIPAICSYVESLAITSNLPSEWAQFRGQLRDWVLAGLRPDP